MTPMTFADPRFVNWLSSETGIDASSLGVNAFGRAVLERVRATQHDELPEDVALDAYWVLLNISPEERQALVESLVVPETWFFREREAFAALARLAHERLASAPTRVLRVLSAPCSSGEEPYSAAMALLDAGIDPTRFTVDAVDISGQAIERAQRAVYGRNSFRGHALEFRARHFNETAEGWQLHERVQRTVRFTQGNLFGPSQQADIRYDFIFCRNVLIYFYRDAQDRAIRLLDAQLADGGTIFVGPAETGLMMRHALTSARIPLAFAFQRLPADEKNLFGGATRADQWLALSAAVPVDGGAVLPVAPIARTTTLKQAPARSTPPPFAASRPSEIAARRAATKTSAPVASASAVSASSGLAEAHRLADAGLLDDAERLVRTFIEGHRPEAEAFYLLGLIADARGERTQAVDFYRKALYLAPAHYEALTHLAVLLDVSGDAAGAQQMTLRAQRAMARMSTRGSGRADPS
ncbi:chemotaxis protein methyltransferase WspC [Paraburkholderia megapolitana]|uniref:Chemotaxis protein methyltransferase WspC n=2 Tax=Paraburkholderia megapolitana TaxID=420953 RepID=A0A1I3LKG9_9BURK|nr:chemotaxis protein methyltransferase WspC [Paraburkholderia megapolitana]